MQQYACAKCRGVKSLLLRLWMTCEESKLSGCFVCSACYWNYFSDRRYIDYVTIYQVYHRSDLTLHTTPLAYRPLAHSV